MKPFQKQHTQTVWQSRLALRAGYGCGMEAGKDLCSQRNGNGANEGTENGQREWEWAMENGNGNVEWKSE